MTDQEISTEQRILNAAQEVFVSKGLAGARMQEIADAASINKAMLNYYFRSKQQLFERIFNDKFSQLFGSIVQILISDIPLEDKIRSFVNQEINLISKFPDLPLFIINEMRQDPELLKKKTKHLPLAELRKKLKKNLEEEYEKGNIRKISFEEFIMNLFSLCVYPIIAQKAFSFILDLDTDIYNRLIEERKSSIAELLINDLRNPRK